jgi:hypothetical protein
MLNNALAFEAHRKVCRKTTMPQTDLGRFRSVSYVIDGKLFGFFDLYRPENTQDFKKLLLRNKKIENLGESQISGE